MNENFKLLEANIIARSSDNDLQFKKLKTKIEAKSVQSFDFGKLLRECINCNTE